MKEDIICARATPSGQSAIAVIRVSGATSHILLRDIFRSSLGDEIQFKTHRAYYGSIVNEKEVIDDVVVLTFAKGKSFTGEESFEINCHGSEVVISQILRLLVAKGARLAEAGEFSKRAFLNGRLALSEAEAIMDIVHASSEQSSRVALQQLHGRLTYEIDALKEVMTTLLAHIEVMIDYPEEDIQVDIENWLSTLLEIYKTQETLIKGFTRGKLFRTGIHAVILGKTNAGKSTLFNYLLNEDKAIVSEYHGTTRDFLDGMILVHGYGVRFFDTAGLRETNDPIEKEGTKRAKDISSRSDVVIYVINGELGLTDEDCAYLKSEFMGSRLLVIINKKDMSPDLALLENEVALFIGSLAQKSKVVTMSALYKQGIDDFNDALVSLFHDTTMLETDDPLVTNERHALLIEASQVAINNCQENLSQEVIDLAAYDLREALNCLGSITGEVTTDDILENIFSDFCVGK